MLLKIHIPSYPLNQFVDNFVYYEGLNPAHAIDRFLPDGNTEIIFDFHDQPQYIYDNDTLKEIQACHHVWASGVRTGYISIPSGRQAAMFIIAFKKGMAYPFFPVPMNEMSDRVVDADLLWGRSFGHLREHLHEISNVDQKFAAAERFLLKHYQRQFNLNPAVEYALAEIIRSPDQLNLRRVSDKIGYSQKHFIAMFKQQVGVTPKAYLKIMRFQKAINEVEQSPDIDWAAISLDCGFYDQAHFIHDFKFFSGFTPEDYLQRKSDLLNYIPVA